MIATTSRNNLASHRVMEKAGMTLVRSFRMSPQELLAEGTVQGTPDDGWE